MAKRATNITIDVFTALCPCGGAVVNQTTGSSSLEPAHLINGDRLECEECASEIKITRKTARL